VIPDLKLKMKFDCIPDEGIRKLREVSHFVDEMANLPPKKHQPYVGDSAFTHKAGLHVQAVRKNSLTYEHIEPELVGNNQRILVSEQAGTGNILYKAEEFGVDLNGRDRKTKEILKTIKDLENQGFQFEGAEASFELLMKKALGEYKRFFNLRGFRVINEKRKDDTVPFSEATIMIEVDGKIEHTAAVGDGPVNALDNAIRKALEKFYPQLKEVKLLDYKVRVLPAGKGTGSAVRVLIQSGDKEETWDTVGVSENIIQASWQALVDSLEYKLAKDIKRKPEDPG
jgi:2-isopropylmalate synthase